MSKRILFPPIAAIVASLLLSVFVACDGRETVRPDLLNRAADPDSGYQFLLGTSYGFAIGLTMSSLDSLWTIWPPTLRAAAEQATPEERRIMTYDRYGLLAGVSDVRGRSPEVPLNFTENPDSKQLQINCLVCHAGKILGRVTPGISNTHAALQTLVNDLITFFAFRWLDKNQNKGLASIDTLENPPASIEALAVLVRQARAEAEEKGIELAPMNSALQRLVEVVVGGLEKFLELDVAGRDSLIEKLLGDGIIGGLAEAFVRFRIPVLSNTDGTTNAFYLAAQLGTFRNLNVELTRLPRRDVPPLPQWATETPAWFNSRKKKLYYHDGFIEDTPGDLMQFLMGPVNPDTTITRWYPQFQDLLEWMWSLKAPKWPEDTLGVIDRDLAQRGLLVFTNNCAQCHGFYGAGEGSFREGWHNQDIINTDSMRLYGMGRPYRAFLRDSFFGADGSGPGGKAITILQPPGYIAPPLDGIWATPPYFHNGAVPTLMDVLNYNDRPKIWTRTEDGYDSLKVGLEHQVFDALPAGLAGWQNRMYYQDSLTGKSVSGHEYPAPPQSLTHDEKLALIEYLKTL